MRCMKYSTIVWTVGLAIAACLACAGLARAETVPANVALFQTVTLDSGTLDTTKGSASNLSNDIIDGSTARITFTSTLGALTIDLGGPYDLESLDVNLYAGGSGAKIRGYATLGGAAIGEYTLGGNTAQPTLEGWDGVRYVTISDEKNDSTKMVLRELRTFAQVETYENFIAGVTVTATSSYGTTGDVIPAALCNSGGMTDQRGPVGRPDALSIPTGPFWQPASGTFSGTVTFDLGQVRGDLDKMLVWNLNQLGQADRCMKDALIEYSQDGAEWVTTSLANGGNFTLPQVTENTQNGYGLAVDLTAVDARYVRITGLTNYTADGLSENTGLSEVRFYAVPEPSIVVMALLGFGLLAAARRR